MLDFVNRVRGLPGLDGLPCVWLSGTEPADETHCIVAAALGLPVGAPGQAPADAIIALATERANVAA